MKDVVKIIHLGLWYKAFGDDAKVLSSVTGFKLFEDIKTGKPSVGFPEYSIDKVTNLLCMNRVSYKIVPDEEKVHDFGKINNYQKFLNSYVPFSHVIPSAENLKKPRGSFIIKFEGEEKELYTIGENINEETELVKKVVLSNENDVIDINGYKVLLIKKEIEFK